MASTGLRAAVSLVALAAVAQALPHTSKRNGDAFTREGCFVSRAGGKRLLDTAGFASDSMTVASCADFCADHQYFGLEYGRECFCGASLSGSAVDDSDCSFPCAGDAAETCGAGDRLDVYVNTAYTPPASPETVGDFEHLGCFTDRNDQRTLRGAARFESDMTLDKCAAACSAYSFFGVEYGTQCFCGVELDEEAQQVDEAECSMRCGGDAGAACGAADRLNVYVSADCKIDPTNPPSVAGFAYQSCWVDNAGGRRVLTGAEHRSDDMTVDKCAALCAGFQFFGVEHASECFCGNELAGESAPESDCSVLCSGDPKQWCGAPDRLNVYAAESAVVDSAPLPTLTVVPAV